MRTQILRCACTHAFQDERYGAGNRVHNRMKSDKSNTPEWRCTVCSSKQSAPEKGK